MDSFSQRILEMEARGTWEEEEMQSLCKELAGRFSVQLLEVHDPEALQGQDLESLCEELPSMDLDDPRRIDIGIATAKSRYVFSDVEGSPLRPSVRCNGLWYCVDHEREICVECGQDRVVGNNREGFQLPENRMPEFPRLLMDSRDWQLVRRVYRRWYDLQRTLHPAPPAPGGQQVIHLPAAQLPDEVKASAWPLWNMLLQLFGQLQGMATIQRYYFANQAKIMLEDYDTFNKAAVLYEEELADWFSEGSRTNENYDEHLQVSARTSDLPQMMAELGLTVDQVRQLVAAGIVKPFDKKIWLTRKAKASIVNTFGFFMGLNTQRTFWRVIELTADAFVLHLRKYDEAADGEVVVTEKAKTFVMQCLAHVFWSLQFAQHRLDQLRALQYQIYQRRDFPFYPFQLEALEAGLDVHLIIAKLCKASMMDFPLVASLFSAFQQASQYSEQMNELNAEVMAAYDELSTRFRVMEVLLLIAHLVATEAEVKAALVTFKFEPAAQDVTSKMDHIAAMLSEGGDYGAMVVSGEQVTVPMTLTQSLQSSMTKRFAAPRKPSFLQRLLNTENNLRHKFATSFMVASLLTSKTKGFTADMFSTYKDKYLQLYHDSIRQKYKEHEFSLLPLDVSRRFQHRKEVAKIKRRDKSKADMDESRDVPTTTPMDPSIFWGVGDGSLEKYVAPVVHEKVKTRKQLEGEEFSMSDAGSETSEFSHDKPATEGVGVHRPLDQLKKSDLVTRDILWRKVKGILKWSSLVQLLTRLGCWILNLDGSKRKVVDPHSGRCTVLHMPHPGDECRPDQRDSYRLHIEDWLKIDYTQITLGDEAASVDGSMATPS